MQDIQDKPISICWFLNLKAAGFGFILFILYILVN